MYVEDAADALMLAAQCYNDVKPVNLGSGEEIPISGLVNILTDIMEFDGEVIWDRAYREFNWSAATPLREGLERTVEWWEGQNDRTS